MKRAYAMAVIGGGLVGAAVAWGMRALGERLVLIDALESHAASRAAMGLVWVQGKGFGRPEYAAWTLASARAWPRLATTLRETTGIDVAFEQHGGLHVCLTAAEMEARAARLAALSAQAGVECGGASMLTRAEIAARVPAIGREVAGGSFCALDGHCDPLRLAAALHAGLAREGVVRRLRERVEAIEPASSGFRLRAGDREIDVDRVVVAAGRGTRHLGARVGLDVPLADDTGQVLVLERMQRFLPFPLDAIRQTPEGNVLVGASHEPRDDASLDLPVLGAIARRAQAILPALAGARVLRAWAAPRVMPPDGFPVYAQSASHPGAFAVACHSGVTLAAAHAFDLAPAILSGTLATRFAPFAAARFAHVHAPS